MSFDPEHDEQPYPPMRGEPALRREMRLIWLASVRATLLEATALVDAIVAQGVDAEEARARLIPAREAAEALRAVLGTPRAPASDGEARGDAGAGGDGGPWDG